MIDLSHLASQLPYEAMRDPELSLLDNNTRNRGQIVGDLDGDGLDEIIVGVEMGLLACKYNHSQLFVLWQQNLPQSFLQEGPPIGLGCTSDIDGDGADEIFLTATLPDKNMSRLWGFDTARNQIICDINLPVGPDRNGDGIWDGYYLAAGTLTNICEDGHAAVLLQCIVHYDAYPRGLIAIDPRDGTEIWRFDMGPNPIQNALWIGNLDEDGYDEVICTSTSPANLKGDLINSTSDDKSWLFAIDHDGELIWRQPLGEYFFASQLIVADLDGDGVSEIATATRHHGAGDFEDQLTVHALRTGEPLSQISVTSSYLGLEFLPSTEEMGGYLFTGSHENHISRYRFDGHDLICDRIAQLDSGANIMASGQCLPSTGMELIASTGAGDILILDENLSALASYPFEIPIAGVLKGTIWQPPRSSSRFITYTSQGRLALSFQPAHIRSLGWLWMLLGLAGAINTAAIFWWRRNRQKSLQPELLPKSIDREALRRVLNTAELSGHGQLKAIGGLKRVVWQLGSALDEESDVIKIEDGLKHSLTDYRASIHDTLEGFLSNTHNSGYQLDLVRRTQPALAKVWSIIQEIEGEELPRHTAKDIYDRLESPTAIAVDGINHLVIQLVEFFTVDAGEMVTCLIGLQAHDLAEAGITVEIQTPSNGKAPLCIIEASELRFILENLLGNAIEAMCESIKRTLTVSFHEFNETLSIRVSDSGIGVPPEKRESIFEVGISAKSNGGLGLPQSRVLLREWKGELNLEYSEVGSGSSFLLRIPKPRAGGNDDRTPISSNH
ncbi:MAG: GHKL domain-containing protein [Candidatus Eisenbacteria bacterium]|uniref:histidine kinase n=1 Tax=Eiseniibacteriota bacterium TaxID=2212470 RepID=A0A948RWC7_UNCEI|nr:GHKL domain-containing protein [Candidatus Eisenbacteria bacterium]MBU1949801.1 GHKL domain-containing protein [Candidatus Eisenbacteria bacterium]MBU2691701.1 GHKL domain-containing protein [Candidatus Eisenbacteria bacterium]